MYYILDDDPLACQKVRELLENCGVEKEICCERDPLKGLGDIKKFNPELLFLDVDMPHLNGFDFLDEVHRAGLKPYVIFTTVYDSYLLEALRVRAVDYLLKPLDQPELRQALMRYAGLCHEQLKNFKKLKAWGLSDRQIQIAREIFKGKTSADIARDLFLSKHTVDTHRSNILRLTDCKNTVELFELI